MAIFIFLEGGENVLFYLSVYSEKIKENQVTGIGKFLGRERTQHG